MEKYVLTDSDILYYRDELKKSYVDLNSLINFISMTYGVDKDYVVYRLREIDEDHALTLKKVK